MVKIPLVIAAVMFVLAISYTQPVLADDCTVSTMNVTRGIIPFDLTLVYQAQDGSDIFARNFYNQTDTVSSVVPVNCNVDYYISGYFNPTFPVSGIAEASVATVPNGYKSDFTHVSKKGLGTPNPLGLESMGSLFGMPLVFIFVIAVASIFTPRSAPMGIIIIVVTLGIMAYMGYIDFESDPESPVFLTNAATWGLIIVVAIVGVLVGKRWD